MQALATRPVGRLSVTTLTAFVALVSAFLLGSASGYLVRTWTPPATTTSHQVIAPQPTPRQTILP